jgi:membrane protease YdiL (CAAX protease family)
MLFYIKKWIWLEILVTAYHLSITFQLDVISVIQAVIAVAIITSWTFVVQKGYGLIKGKAFEIELTQSLAGHYAAGNVLQAFFGAITAACGEELFFRGFIQTKWGVIAGAIAFGLAHFGKKDIRTVSYWAFGHGLLFGLTYYFTGNLAVPMMTHGMFDFGGLLYFRSFMRRQTTVA